MSEPNFIIIPAPIPRQAFVAAAVTEFPAVADELLDEDYAGLINLQVGCLATYANDCLAVNRLNEFGRILRFFERVLPDVDTDVDNAFYVSFLEFLRLEGSDATTMAARRLLAPEHLQAYIALQQGPQQPGQTGASS